MKSKIEEELNIVAGNAVAILGFENAFILMCSLLVKMAKMRNLTWMKTDFETGATVKVDNALTPEEQIVH